MSGHVPRQPGRLLRMDQDKPSSSQPQAGRTLAKPPQLPPGQTWMEWARQQWSQGCLDNAEYGLRKEIEAAPDSPWMLGLLGRLLMERKQPDQAIPVFEQALTAAAAEL